MGQRPLLIEPTQHLGGLTISGLGFTDTGDKSKIGGLAREFYQRIKRHYDRPEAWKFERPEQYARYRPDDDAMWTFEPHVAETDASGRCWPRPGPRVLLAAAGSAAGCDEFGPSHYVDSHGVGSGLSRSDVYRRDVRRRPDGGRPA